MTDKKRHYWGIVNYRKMMEDEILFKGTFNECWDKLVKDYGDKPLSEFAATGSKSFGIRIARIG